MDFQEVRHSGRDAARSDASQTRNLAPRYYEMQNPGSDAKVFVCALNRWNNKQETCYLVKK